jgi:hypothetical protein
MALSESKALDFRLPRLVRTHFAVKHVTVKYIACLAVQARLVKHGQDELWHVLRDMYS